MTVRMKRWFWLSRLTPASSSQVGLLKAFLIISDNTPYDNELLTAVNIFNRRDASDAGSRGAAEVKMESFIGNKVCQS